MNMHAAVDFKQAGLEHPGGDRLRLDGGNFIAIDRDSAAAYNATYRPQALYNRAEQGFQATNEAFLLHEVATNLPIHRSDTGPTDFHLHLPPGGFQLVVVTSGMFAFDYDGRYHYVGPGAAILQSAIVHRQFFYTWSGFATDTNLKTPQTLLPDPTIMGYSGKFLEGFITDPTAFPNPTILGPEHIDETRTPRTAWCHALHDRPAGAGFWVQDPLALDALYKKLPGDVPGVAVKPDAGVYVRDLGIETPSGALATGHILATDPHGRASLPKSSAGFADVAAFGKCENVVYRVVRGTAEFTDATGKSFGLSAGDTVTAGRQAATLVALAEDTQILRIGLLRGFNNLRKWTPAQRDEIDGLGGRIITRTELRPLRTEGQPVGYLYG